MTSRSSADRSRSPRPKMKPDRGGHKVLARESKKDPPIEGTSTATEGQQPAQTAYSRAIFELFLKNDLSAKGAQQLAQKAQAAGAKGAERIVAAGRGGHHEQNLSRDIMRSALRKSKLPDLYYSSIPTRDPGADTNQIPTLFPFLLVHEVMYSILQSGQKLCSPLSEIAESTANSLRSTAKSLKVELSDLAPIGFHGDAAPNQANKSILSFSWNLLGLEGSDRMLFTAIPQENVCRCGCGGRHTIDAIVRIFVWSINLTFGDYFPATRHDLTPFTSSADRNRKKQIGTSLGFRSVLLQCRGDWAWFKELFSFPSWASKNLCWRCQASQDGNNCYKNFGLKAAWRKTRLTAADFFQLQQDQGIEPSPLFQAIGFKLALVCIDCLHCMDLGTTQDILGNIFWECLGTVCKGPNRKARVTALWSKIKEYYSTFEPPTKLNSLTVEMIKQTSKAVKLRAKGAETRHLVPFGALLAKEFHAVVRSPRSQTIQTIALLIMDIYMHLSLRPYQAEVVADSCRRLCILYSALSEESQANGQDHQWRIKPKMHMMVELLEYQSQELEGSPSEFWAYMDEDFVGWVARMSSRRGGPAGAASAAETVLKRYVSLKGG